MRKWEVFGFSLLSENYGILDNSDFAVFVDPSDAIVLSTIVPRPFFLGHCFDFPIQELLQQSTIPAPRNTECSALLCVVRTCRTRTKQGYCSVRVRVEQNRARVSMFEILPNTNRARVLFGSVRCGAELEQTKHVLENVLFVYSVSHL